MLRFESDYAEGAHPKILEALCATNLEQTPGYGADTHCENAANLIRQACETPEAAVHFVVGGTQANKMIITSILRPHQAVICADTGHINWHESGAIEAGGHKIMTLANQEGKITAQQVDALCTSHWADEFHEHTTQPGMVYISNPTEAGTLYGREELQALSQVCRRHHLPLFVDGARLGYGMMSPACDFTLPELAQWADVFYIGGTKVGALFGEAIVFSNPRFGRDFRYIMKQTGAMLAKGRLLGIQFETLFTDNLYFEISQSAIREAMRIRDAFAKKGFLFHVNSPTNQQFPLLDDLTIEKLQKNFAFMVWPPSEESLRITRFCTSWCTTKESVDTLVAAIEAL